MFKFFKESKSKAILGMMLAAVMVIGFVPATYATETDAPVVTQEVVLAETSSSIDILLFNDFHGNVAEDSRETGNVGMAKMVGYVNDAKAKNPNTIVVAGGDNYQGTAMSNLTYGKPVTAMMKAMDVVVSAVGNHEFDWGVDLLETWAKEGDFDFLAANIMDTKTNKPVKWAKPYEIVEQAGVKIAFIGLAHEDTVTLTKAENVTGLEFTDPVAAAKEWVKFLQDGKAKEGKPDVIMALTHIDSSQDRDTKAITGNAVALTEVEGIDAVLSAHSHRTVCGKVNDVPVVQAYENGRAMGVISIALDKDGKAGEITCKVDEIQNTKSDIIADDATKTTYAVLETELKPILGEVIGTASDVFLHNTREQANVTTLGRWASDIMRKQAGTQIGILNGGGLRRTLEAGEITMGDLYEIMPFDNVIVTMDLKGKDIKKAIDHGIFGNGQFVGLQVEYDKNKEFGNRITKIALEDGTPLEMEAYYSVATIDFLLTGGDKYDFSKGINVVETYVPVRDGLVAAIQTEEVITPVEVDYLTEIVGAEVEEEEKEEEKEKEEVVAGQSYKVVAGDALWKIAKKFNTTWQKIAELNSLKNPNLIYPNQSLLIPAK